MTKASFTKAASVLIISLFLGISSAQADTDPFPMPDIIAPNVAFWTKVYAHYSTGQGIVHDSIDMDRIYEVIDLLPYDVAGATETNRIRMKQAVQRYETILRELARDPNATDPHYRRVADLFSEPPTAAHYARAAQRVRCQIGQKDRFQAGLIRSGAYMEQILSTLRSHGLPEDLAYLPHVESSFNPNAYSKSGAAGMWQFTTSTGRLFMEVGYVLDERRDPFRATHAAARLLKENYAKLGSWPLALTAYNHGTAGMQRAQSTHGDYARVFQYYQSPSFKFASRNFYSEFLAARHVASNYRDYFGDIELDRPVATRTVVMDGYVSFKQLSTLFNVDPETLKKMNLALRDPVFNGQKHVPKGYALRLPAVQGSDPTMQMAAIPESYYQQEQRASRFHTVRSGDTVSMIARINGVKVSDLILANNLNRHGTIYPRQTLRIPRGGEDVPTVAKKQETITLAKVENQQPAPDAAPVAATAARENAAAPAPTSVSQPIANVAAEPVTEDIAHADTIAETIHDITTETVTEPEMNPYPQPVLASIIALPQTENDSDLVRVAAATLHASNEQIVTADIRFEQIEIINGQTVGILQVEVEETLGHYADWAGVKTQSIRNLNKLRDGNLRLHRKIKIPLSRVGAETFEQNRYEYHKRLQEDFFAVYRIGELQPYYVQSGDNYWSLCQQKFQIPMWLLMHANPELDLAALSIGQKLIIPMIEKASTKDADPGIEEEFDASPAESHTEESV